MGYSPSEARCIVMVRLIVLGIYYFIQRWTKLGRYLLLRTQPAAGLTIVLVSRTLQAAIGLSDRLVCMRDARVAGILETPRGGKPPLLSVIARVV